jgi:hypothetical protein
MIPAMQTSLARQSSVSAPLRKVERRIPATRSLAHDVLSCGHSVVVLRFSRQLPYWHCYSCQLPRCDSDAFELFPHQAANANGGGR